MAYYSSIIPGDVFLYFIFDIDDPDNFEDDYGYICHKIYDLATNTIYSGIFNE